jgi:membrane protease YdiL (CAAX protease family)
VPPVSVSPAFVLRTLTVLAFVCGAILCALRFRGDRARFGPDRSVFIEGLSGFGIGGVVWCLMFVIFLLIRVATIQSARFDLVGIVSSLMVMLARVAPEEFVYRVLMFPALLYLVRNPWAALLIQAALFGLAHGANPGATILSTFSVTLGGVMYGLAYLGTGGRVWMALGLHAAWNWFQGPVFGFAVSGNEIASSVLVTQLSGPALLSGGAFGPEATLIAIAGRLLICVLVVLVARRLRVPRAWLPGQHVVRMVTPAEAAA